MVWQFMKQRKGSCVWPEPGHAKESSTSRQLRLVSTQGAKWLFPRLGLPFMF